MNDAPNYRNYGMIRGIYGMRGTVTDMNARSLFFEIDNNARNPRIAGSGRPDPYMSNREVATLN